VRAAWRFECRTCTPPRGARIETQEQSKAQKIALEDTKNSVITRTAMAYLELGKVRHSLRPIAQGARKREKILQVTAGSPGEGYELPVEVDESPAHEKRR